MNPFITQLIIETVRSRLKKKKKSSNDEDIKDEINIFKVNFKHLFKDSIFIIIGIAAAGFGLKGFLIPNSFFDGGVMGISLLSAEFTDISISILIVLINLPFLLIGYTQVGKLFALKSLIAIIGLAIVIYFIPYPVITNDNLLIAFFGGFFLGAGIGLSIRGGAVLDGTEVLAIFLSKRTGLTIGDIVFIFNIIIFSLGAYTLSMEIALYAILTYLISSRTVNFIVKGVEEYTGITIISDYSDEICMMITEKLGRGFTVYSGKGGYGKQGDNLKQFDIVYTVITRLEIAKLRREIDKIDPDSFITMNTIKDTKGGMIKKRLLEKK